MAKCNRSSPSSFFIFRRRLTTARQGPHHCWCTSTTRERETKSGMQFVGAKTPTAAVFRTNTGWQQHTVNHNNNYSFVYFTQIVYHLLLAAMSKTGSNKCLTFFQSYPLNPWLKASPPTVLDLLQTPGKDKENNIIIASYNISNTETWEELLYAQPADLLLSSCLPFYSHLINKGAIKTYVSNAKHYFKETI